ncbi:MAG: mammalian cell entry protein, partial [Mycobacterium sp.]
MTEADSATRPVRRRASRAAGPTGNEAATATVQVGTAAPPVRRPAVSAGPPPRRPAHRRLVGWVALAFGLSGIAVLAGGLAFEMIQQRHADTSQAREQRFVDTATQTVVNMFSYTQDNVDQSVGRFVDGTSGPLRGMLSSNNNVENIKALVRHTNASSEAVINGAALEDIANVTANASVLV